MTAQHDAEGAPAEGTQSDSKQTDESAHSVNGDGSAPFGIQDTSGGSPQHSRALLAIVAAGTLAMAPISGTVIGIAGSGYSGHSSPAYLLAELSHDIGHNDWAFEGGFAGRVIWSVTYVALALAWFFVTLWMRARDRRAARAAGPAGKSRPRRRLWLKTWGAVLAVEFAAGVLTISAAISAQWTATSLGPVVLRLADACSPWWSCVAALVVVARAERNTIALRAAIAYGAVLTLLLLVPLPGPNDIKTLILAATVGVPALFDRRAAVGSAQTLADSPVPAPSRPAAPEALSITTIGSPDAAAAG